MVKSGFRELLFEVLSTEETPNHFAFKANIELIHLAKAVKESIKKRQKLRLSHDELAFYEALEVNDCTVYVLEGEKLRLIALQSLDTVRKIQHDWILRENVKSRLRLSVKRILTR